VRRALLEALCEADPAAKCARVAALPATWAPLADEAVGAMLAQDPRIPGRPARPTLVSPRDVPFRGLGGPEGRAALVHAVAHIEFNAVNLALDAALRFDGLPPDYYADWLRVARDEARHFTMLSGRLAELGHAYGDFTAHNGLWEAAQKTAHDPLLRMALVPRVLEARGLDVTPGLIRRLREVGDARTAGILCVILDEEVAHVAIGTRWYRYLCDLRGVDPASTFRAVLAEHRVRLQRPLNLEARTRAGFESLELEIPDEGGCHPK
jgi:uncharacterized ferritin-like protein (DUF455 family)